MNATTYTYNEAKAKQVENAVMQVFQCSISDLIGNSDTQYKKVVVFILNKLLGYDKRNIGVAYSITYLFVPTVVNEIENEFLLNFEMRKKITEVTKIIGYESRCLEERRIEFVA
ncbi:MAG: hypothetical protein ACI8WA_000011 [Polaribacter sp.]|jgi:hypothetical protein